ncbi:hypothetical protein ACGFSB_34420 [Streptomyces sp. NPDC048441]|uniref:hypothetical protein n=1 Tax=Streptomyces sp. NPDC048441 TaxID=3365552 RepID=UPI00372069EC
MIRDERTNLAIDGFEVAAAAPPLPAEPEPEEREREQSRRAGGEVEDIEELVADLQLGRRGLAGRDPEPAPQRAVRLTDEVAFLGLSRLVTELAGGGGPPAPALRTTPDLGADEDGRRDAYERQRAEARERVGEVWQWLAQRRRQRGDGPDRDERWRCSGPVLPPLPGTPVQRIDITAPVVDLAPLAQSWARAAGLGDGTREHNWRLLRTGKGRKADVLSADNKHVVSAANGFPLPRFGEVLLGLVGQIRARGLLPPAHKVRLISRPGVRTEVTPVRLPGLSLLSVDTGVTPLSYGQLQHAIGHIAEYAARPSGLCLAERWSLCGLRSEGWALLIGQLVQAPAFLVETGLDEHSAQAVAGFLADEERFSRGLMAADLALDAELAECRGVADALDAAGAVAARTGLERAPELMLLRQTRLASARHRLAGHAWCDAALAELDAGFGTGWADRDGAWELLRETLRETDTATGFLRALRAARTPRSGRHLAGAAA